MAPEPLFLALDGRDLTVSGRNWRIEVFSVCDHDARRWVQLALRGKQEYVLTLALAAGDGLSQAVTALADRLTEPEMSSVA